MRRRILIVDDERANRVLMQAMLAPLECDIVLAADGEEALARFEQGDIDLIILDIMMPRLSGLDVLRRIRARTDMPWTPVILATAHSEREVRLEGVEAGADEFAEKPVDRAMLTARVRTLLRLREAQEQLEQRAQALERSNLERRELMNFIVHDMKNPLAVIRMNLMYVRDAAATLAPDHAEALTDAAVAGERMSGMVQDLLAVERMEQASLSLSRSRVEVGELVREIVRMRQHETDARQVEVRVEAQPCFIDADRPLLRRLVENLFENALKHVPRKGDIEVLVECGEHATITVSNTGQPVPESLRPLLFEKFVRGTGNGDRGRVGLGLYFSRRVAALHDGRLELVDRDGWPVTFRLELPLHEIVLQPSESA